MARTSCRQHQSCSHSIAVLRQRAVLPRLSPLLGHSEHPKGLTRCQESVAGWCCISIPDQHCAYRPGWHCFKLSFVGLDVNLYLPGLYGAACLKWWPKTQLLSFLSGSRSHSGMQSHGAPCRATTLDVLSHT